jgi:hypothetical protein
MSQLGQPRRSDRTARTSDLRRKADNFESPPACPKGAIAEIALSFAHVPGAGEPRAMSFRGVTSMGNDANGTAERRIGLLKDGTIGRIALGPQ